MDAERHLPLPPSARKAEPVLASALIGDAELEGIVDGVFDQASGARNRAGGEEEIGRVGIGVKSVDDAVTGGLRMGSVVAVSGEGGGAVSQILMEMQQDEDVI
jgi:predicted ATP-dependent serine protease